MQTFASVAKKEVASLVVPPCGLASLWRDSEHSKPQMKGSNMNPCFKQKRTTVAPVAPENRSPRKKAEGQIPPSLKHEVEKYKIDVVENVASAKAPASVTTKDTVRKLTDQFEQDRLAGAKFAERHLDINKVIKENFAIMPEDSRAWSISSGWG